MGTDTVCMSSALRCQNNLLCRADIGPQQCCPCSSENVRMHSLVVNQLSLFDVEL